MHIHPYQQLHLLLLITMAVLNNCYGEVMAYTTLVYFVFTMHIDAKATPTDDTDYRPQDLFNQSYKVYAVPQGDLISRIKNFEDFVDTQRTSKINILVIFCIPILDFSLNTQWGIRNGSMEIATSNKKSKFLYRRLLAVYQVQSRGPPQPKSNFARDSNLLKS